MSLAAAMMMKKRAKKKMCDGGDMYAEGGDVEFNDEEEASGYEKMPEPYARKMAGGGFVEKEQRSGFVDHEGDDVKHNYAAMHEDDRSLNQHGEDEIGPEGVWMAEGGMLTDDGYQTDAHDMDMVGRAMIKRQKMYSKGGMVANGGEDDLDKMADGRPNNFDDLSMRDDLESSYDGENSGDELDNEQQDHDREDIVSRIMRSRAKKDRLPNPR